MSKIVVLVQGGLVQKVYADNPVEVVIVDQNVEGAADDEVVRVFGEESAVRFDMPEVDPAKVAEAFVAAGSFDERFLSGWIVVTAIDSSSQEATFVCGSVDAAREVAAAARSGSDDEGFQVEIYPAVVEKSKVSGARVFAEICFDQGVMPPCIEIYYDEVEAKVAAARDNALYADDIDEEPAQVLLVSLADYLSDGR